MTKKELIDYLIILNKKLNDSMQKPAMISIHKVLQLLDKLELDIEREKLAALCHKQWAHWMKYLFSKCDPEYETDNSYCFDDILSSSPNGNTIINKQEVDRWTKQMNTAYKDLSEKEKDSDRKEADKFLKELE